MHERILTGVDVAEALKGATTHAEVTPQIDRLA